MSRALDAGVAWRMSAKRGTVVAPWRRECPVVDRGRVGEAASRARSGRCRCGGSSRRSPSDRGTGRRVTRPGVRSAGPVVSRAAPADRSSRSRRRGTGRSTRGTTHRCGRCSASARRAPARSMPSTSAARRHHLVVEQHEVGDVGLERPSPQARPHRAFDTRDLHIADGTRHPLPDPFARARHFTFATRNGDPVHNSLVANVNGRP